MNPKPFLVDTITYFVFWSSFAYIVNVVVVRISFTQYAYSSILGFIYTAVLARPFGKFLDYMRGRFHTSTTGNCFCNDKP